MRANWRRAKTPSSRVFGATSRARRPATNRSANYAPYVTNKFDAFTTNEIIRPIISQQKSAFNFRDLMDNRKILLVNLAKGRIGELNANLLGLVIVGKFLIAALSRADSFGKPLPAFYLHIDEFQNFATPSIATILSEARKYKLSLTVAHQFIAQLTDEIRDAVFGNVGSMAAFRIGAQDAEVLEKQFSPVFSAQDLIRIDNFNAHVKLLVGGKPAAPFNIQTLPFESGSMEHIAQMAEISALRYGRPRAEVEAESARGLTPTVQENPTTPHPERGIIGYMESFEKGRGQKKFDQEEQERISQAKIGSEIERIEREIAEGKGDKNYLLFELNQLKQGYEQYEKGKGGITKSPLQ